MQACLTSLNSICCEDQSSSLLFLSRPLENAWWGSVLKKTAAASLAHPRGMLWALLANILYIYSSIHLWKDPQVLIVSGSELGTGDTPVHKL